MKGQVRSISLQPPHFSTWLSTREASRKWLPLPGLQFPPFIDPDYQSSPCAENLWGLRDIPRACQHSRMQDGFIMVSILTSRSAPWRALKLRILCGVACRQAAHSRYGASQVQSGFREHNEKGRASAHPWQTSEQDNMGLGFILYMLPLDCCLERTSNLPLGKYF